MFSMPVWHSESFRKFLRKHFLPPVEVVNPIEKITNPKINFSYMNGY